jgi:3-phenylpropionate/cinnamic acid dioxygenase small subunit
MTTVVAKAAAVTARPDRQTIEQFLFHEARLADEHRYDEWEALWTDDALYWVPIREDRDPETQVSYIFDNRARIASRIRQLKTGRRHAQTPPSDMRRLVSNVEVIHHTGHIEAQSNFILIESRRGAQITWAGRVIHELVPTGEGLKMRKKQVLLVNRREAIFNLAFLI